MTPDLESLKAACESRIPAEILAAKQLEAVSVGGSARLYAETHDDGTGLYALWSWTRWLVDPATCASVGLGLDGARGVVEEEAYFRGQGTEAEQGWLLAKAGYLAFDPVDPKHALAARTLETPESVEPRSLTLDRLRVDVSAAPALDWHAGPAPSRFDPAWIPADDLTLEHDGVCPCYRIPHPRRLFDRIVAAGSLRLHAYSGEAVAFTNDRAAVVEDPARHRWAFYAAEDGPDIPVGTDPDATGALAPPPKALAGWRWSQVPNPSDPGVTGLVADGAQPWTWVSFQLRISDDHGGWDWPARISWVQGGLSVQPFDGDPILLPSATLLELLGP